MWWLAVVSCVYFYTFLWILMTILYLNAIHMSQYEIWGKLITDKSEALLGIKYVGNYMNYSNITNI